MHKINVITVRQPWAELLMLGAKHNETRSWKTSFRGELFIHSAMKLDFNDLELCHSNQHYKDAIPKPTLLKSGFILGKVTVVDCVPVGELKNLSEAEFDFGKYWNDWFAWICENPMRLRTPIRAWGKQGFWKYEVDGREFEYA